MTEATLPLFPDATLGRAEPAGETLGCHGDVEDLDMPVREILTRNRS